MQKHLIVVIAVSAVLFGLNWWVSPLQTKSAQQVASAPKAEEVSGQKRTEESVADNGDPTEKVPASPAPVAIITPAVNKTPSSVSRETVAAKAPLPEATLTLVDAVPQESKSPPVIDSLGTGKVKDGGTKAQASSPVAHINEDNMAKIVQLDKFFEH